MSLPLSALFARSLASASKAYNLRTIEDETQELLQSSLNDLKGVRARVVDLSLFSPNETLEDLSTRDLIYLFVPYVLAEVQGRLRTTERPERMSSLIHSETYLKAFFATLETYEIVPVEERTLYGRQSPNVSEPVRRREIKIAQFKKEKELKTRIAALCKRRGQTPVDDEFFSEFDLIASLLPSSSRTSKTSEADDVTDEDSETDDLLRDTTLLLLRLNYAQAHSQLESMEQELQLLRNAPASPTIATPLDDDARGGKRHETEEDMWKLDPPVPSGGPDGKGPLLDPTGKPLRPFTILPSNAGERARHQSQVFGPSHNLPTMTIDEYLQVEKERGNILTGGGPASQQEPTSSEQLALDAEMDGTWEGDQKEEEKRQKDEEWARFTDENPRGIGNTMNRG